MRKSKAIPKRNSEQFAALCEAVLERGASVRFRAQGRSMQPNILNDDAVVVAPIEREELKRGDVALTQDGDGFRVHRVVFADGGTGEIITRGDASQECDAVAAQVFGKIISIERNGRVHSVDSATKRFAHAFRTLIHRVRKAASLRFRKLAPISAVFTTAILFGILLNAAPAAGQALTITDTATPTTVAPGGTITYTQVLSNNSLFRVTPPITVTQNLPANTTFVSATKVNGTDGTWACGNTAGVITCTDNGNYNSGSSTTFTIVVTVNAATANGTTITDTVNAKGANSATATANTTVTVQTPDISVTNADTPDPVDVASNISYTQTVTNNSTTIAAVGATLSETIPTNTTYQSITIPTGWTCGTLPAVGATGSIACSATGTLAASSSSIFTVVVKVNSTVTTGTVISDTVTIAETGTQTNTTNNTATATSTVQIPDLSVTNTDSPDPVAAGVSITYTQKVTNNSATVPAVGATITQTTPANTTFQSVTPPAGWTCGTKPAVGGTGSIVCSATGTLAAGATVTFTLVVNVNSGTASGTVISDSVTVTETGTDPNTTNSTATATSTVQVPDISVTETVTPNPVSTGANITYTETVTNNGTVPSFGTTLTQTTPPNTNFQSVTPPTGWTCGTQPAVGATGSIVCSVTASLAASTGVNFSVVVQVSPEAVVGSTITNSVSVSQTGTETNLANNTATASTQVQGADLSMTQSASATAIAPGSTITYTETVSNAGPNAATGAVLYQQTPPNTTFVSMTPPTGWTCGTLPAAGGTGTVLCSASANMNANTTTGNFVFIVTVNSATAAGTSIVNTADVTSQTTDPAASNNATNTSVLVEITGDSDLSLSMTAAPSPVFISSNLTYTIQIQNLGLANSADGSLTDTIPTGTTFVSSSTTQGSCSGTATVTCTLGAITRGTTITVAITVSTPATPTTLTNTSTISTTTTDPVSANNSATVLTVVQPLVCASPGRDGAGGTLTGIINAYYSPATGALAAGSKSVVLGAAAAGGAQTPIAVGDLLLFIQAQDAAINSTNTGAYGDGFPGDPGSGFTNLNNAGNFEFVTATSAVPVTGGTLSFTGTGPTSGLLNTYTKAAATATQGQRSYQIVRVPQYTSESMS